MIERTNEVVLDDLTHTYTHTETGLILRPVSTVYGEFKPDFDSQNISWMMARKALRLLINPEWDKGDPEPAMEAILEKQKEILAEWDTKRDNSSDYGTEIHQVCEYIANGKQVDEKYSKLVFKMKALYGHYYKSLPELIVHSLKWGVAGTIDNPLVRQRSDKSLIDIDDYKTNTEKGIEFDSTKIDKNTLKLKHYNRFMLPPLDHLEDCNYNHYAMQQSIYGVLLERQFPPHKIGKITLTFIEEIESTDYPHDYNVTTIPIPFLKLEAEAVLNAYCDKFPFEQITLTKKIVDDPDDF